MKDGNGALNEHLVPVERRSLTQTVSLQLRALIESGPIEPGDALPSQVELARMLGVSRPVVRESLQALAAVGLIDIRPGRGCYVRDRRTAAAGEPLFEVFSHEAALQVIEARMVVEVQLAGFAAERATPKDLSDMASVLSRLQRASSRNRPTVHIASDFHQLINRAGRNEVLFRMAQMLITPRVVQGLRVEQSLPAIIPGEFRSHRLLYDAILSRDPRQASEAMRQHLELAYGWEEHINRLREETAQPAVNAPPAMPYAP